MAAPATTSWSGTPGPTPSPSAPARTASAYEDGPDRIDLRALGLADGFADLLVTRSGASTVVRVDADGNGRPEGSASLTLIDMDRSLITAEDFLF